MPTTFVGLLIFVAFLTPGFLYTAQRRLIAPQAVRSTLMEATSVVSVSLASNLLVGSIFGILRWIGPHHTPELGLLIEPGTRYWIDHLPYVLIWSTLLFAVSCALSLTAARATKARRFLAQRFPAVILESSAWCDTFVADPNSYVHAGLELLDGAFISGRLVWFSTDLEETGDRDLVLGPPLQIRTDDGLADLGVQRVIVAARDIRRIDVSYVTEPSAS